MHVSKVSKTVFHLFLPSLLIYSASSFDPGQAYDTVYITKAQNSLKLWKYAHS